MAYTTVHSESGNKLSERVPWTELFRPKDFDEVVGNKEAKERFREWLLSWKVGGKPALLFGPPGIGKTTLVHVLARELNFELIEMNASDDRTRGAILKIAGRASTEASLSTFISNKKGVLVFLDEVDGIVPREDLGGVEAVLRIVTRSRVPVVLAANTYDPRILTPLRPVCRMIKFNRVRVPSIVKFLRKICRSEGISAEDDALRVIAERCEGDVRSAVNDLQFYAEGKERLTLDEVVSLDKRDRELNVFDTLRSIFSARDCDGVKDAIKRSEVPLVSASKTDLLLTLSENLPLHYSSLEEMAKAYDALSKADVVLGRIKRTQSWKLLDHLLKILATGLAFTKREVAHRRFIFPPMKVIMLSERKHEKRLLDEVCSRIGSKLHISRRVAQIEVLPFVKILMDGPLSHSIITWLNLEKEHVRYLRIAPR